MIGVCPRGIESFQESQEFSATHCFAGGFDKKRAPAARTDNGVDFAHKILRQEDMSAFRFHSHIAYAHT